MEEEIKEKENNNINELNIKSYYFYDINQGSESSKNIYPLLLPSFNLIYIKNQIKKQQVLIPLYIPKIYTYNNNYIKLWKDSKENLLYSITSIDEPLFTKLLFEEELFNIKINSESNDNILSITINDNKNTYKINVNDKFFADTDKYIGSLVGYALYILYFKPLLY